jgi:L-seryl-tRNA(Ser) seleniumtransferase
MNAPPLGLRVIPSVDRILQDSRIEALVERFSRAIVVDELQRHLASLRSAVVAGELSPAGLTEALAALSEVLRERLGQRASPSLRPVVNATGVILHTNIGRAPMARALSERLELLVSSYSNLEYDLEAGRRGHRDQHFEVRVRRVLRCEAATVCNNNAAAVFLILNTLAAGRKVIVSRGELIEIGGSFRIPSIMEKSGAILKEVGTTNRTTVADYVEAIDESTALLFRVHPSNYRITGFAHRPELEELVALSKETKVPLVKDAGSGYLFSAGLPALDHEPTIDDALRKGVDLVCFSGDKLLGGPQAGIILGRRSLVEAIRRNPLMRACRVDKLTYAALDWTLGEYEKGAYRSTLPIYQMLTATVDQLRERAVRLQSQIDPRGFQSCVDKGFSVIGGGSAPGERLETCVLKIRSLSSSTNELERRLRAQATPILARIEEDWLVLDLRTIFPTDETIILAALSGLTTDDESKP